MANDGERPPGSNGCLVSIGLGFGALVALVVTIAGLAQVVREEPNNPWVAVPGGGTVEIEAAGRYTVVYDGRYRDVPELCTERVDSHDSAGRSSTTWDCRPELLVEAGGLTVTGPEGAPVDLVPRPMDGAHPSDLRVWEIEADVAGTYTVALPDPQYGTEEIGFRYQSDGSTGPLWRALVFWSVPLLGFAALVVGIVSLAKRSSATRPSWPPASPLPAGWYPDPTGRTPERWWDGERWTADVRSGSQVAQDPI